MSAGFIVWAIPEAGGALVYPEGVRVMRLTVPPSETFLYPVCPASEYIARLRSQAEDVESFAAGNLPTARGRWLIDYRKERDASQDSESVEMTRLAHAAAVLFGEKPISEWMRGRS